MVIDPFFDREAEKYDSPIASRELILSYLQKMAKPASLENIAAAMQLKGKDASVALHRRLRAMERDGQVIFTRRQCYALPEKLNMIKGTIIGHRDGYGFLRVEGEKKDYFIPADQMRGALHGDVILAQPLKETYRGKQEIRIVRVLEPRNPQIVGRYFIEQGIGFVVPDDSRLSFDILVTEAPAMTVRMGAVVVVELTKRPEWQKKALGRIIELLGENMGTELAIEMAIRNHELPHIFSKPAQEQASVLQEDVAEKDKKNRVDLRQLPLVTIDGEDARDFDDAVYCTKNRGGGWRLWVAIADVSNYVRPGSPIDRDACLRSTSVYFPSRVIPMLPEVLSNGLCSLVPQTDRLCLVAEMTISNKGRLTSFQFYEAVMNSHARLTYTKVGKILAGDEELREHYAPLIPDIENLHALFKLLSKTREARGAIAFESPEPKFIFNAEQRIESIELLQRNDAHKIIEECMIMANVAAARYIEKAAIPVLYRVHDVPDSEKVNVVRSTLSELGLTLGGGDSPEPADYEAILRAIADRPDREMIQTLILRSMKQAIYDPENRGHFGLALNEYAHFTSPIRRYPDLLLHRAIKSVIASEEGKKSDTGAWRYNINEMLYLGEQTSMAERRADEAVRDVVDWLKCDYMMDHVGETFKGTISSVTNFGFFVRLDDLFIDGLVHISSLENDYYGFDAERGRLVGESSGYSYRLGDKVTIKVEAVNPEDRKIDFLLLSSERKPERLGKTAKDNTKKNKKGVTKAKSTQRKGVDKTDDYRTSSKKASIKNKTKRSHKGKSVK